MDTVCSKRAREASLPRHLLTSAIRHATSHAIRKLPPVYPSLHRPLPVANAHSSLLTHSTKPLPNVSPGARTRTPSSAALPKYLSVPSSRTRGRKRRFYPVQPREPRHRALPKRAVGWDNDMDISTYFSDNGTCAPAPGTRDCAVVAKRCDNVRLWGSFGEILKTSVFYGVIRAGVLGACGVSHMVARGQG